MTTLETIIQGILQSFTAGQVGADRYAAKISQDYLDDPILCHFSVPQFAIKTVEIQLKLAIQTVDKEDVAVLVGQEALAKVSTETISTLTFEVVLQNKRWTTTAQEDGTPVNTLIAE